MQWASERLALESVVSDALAFASIYCERHDEGEYYQEISDASKRLSQDVSESLDQLENVLRELLQLVSVTHFSKTSAGYVKSDVLTLAMQEFNLVSIKEARQSVTMSASMKRLTWITVSHVPSSIRPRLLSESPVHFPPSHICCGTCGDSYLVHNTFPLMY